ncbi:hypothetical protein K6119_10500 [Paracrocinitomix mangrovi]|uniref:hypothetical protein n=1 Tax=Paracrocinitomix mangrovi TaxID=2862509 RepID=UPI001C8D24F9|nr:hypothetical protein [Paracrocinitomix mangrovi]UKN00164.1 hypothetical protein K6119_10500 [Paracrocinitomix mangrovi]
MKSLFRSTFILLLSFNLVSCFEITEDITIHSDGNGILKIQADFSESKFKINSILEHQEYEGYQIPSRDKIKSTFNQLVNLTDFCSNISIVSSDIDLENYIINYSCKFNEVEDVNVLVDSIKTEFNSDLNPKFKYLKYDRKKGEFSRNGDNFLKDKVEQLPLSQRVIFNSAYYTCIYRFDNLIDSNFTSGAKTSTNRKISTKKLSMKSLTFNGELINHKIQTIPVH